MRHPVYGSMPIRSSTAA